MELTEDQFYAWMADWNEGTNLLPVSTYAKLSTGLSEDLKRPVFYIESVPKDEAGWHELYMRIRLDKEEIKDSYIVEMACETSVSMANGAIKEAFKAGKVEAQVLKGNEDIALARAGVTKLKVIEKDPVTLANVQRMQYDFMIPVRFISKGE